MILIDQKQTRLLHETMEQFLVNVLSRTLLHYLSLVTHQLQSWLSFGAMTIYYRQRLKKRESRQNFSKNRRCSSAFKAALDSAKCRRIFFLTLAQLRVNHVSIVGVFPK